MKRGRKVGQRTRFTLRFQEHDSGASIPDLLVAERVIVDAMVPRPSISPAAHR